MRKKKLLRSAVLSTGISVMMAASALPCSVYAEQTLDTQGTLAASETADAGMVDEVSEPEKTAEVSDTETAAETPDAEVTAETSAEETVAETADAEAAAEDSDTEAEAEVSESETDTGVSDTEMNAEASGTDRTQKGQQQTEDSSGDRSSQKSSTTSSVQTVDKYDYDITVTFTKQRGVLTDLSVTADTSAKNNKYTSKALAQITEQLKSGSEADVVSGATYSSDAILAAITEAGDYDSVSENLTSSLNGETPSSSSSSKGDESGSGQSGKGQGESGQSGSEQGTSKTVPANYITYTVDTNSEGRKEVVFQLSDDARNDNTYVNMVLFVDDSGKHFMPVDSGSDETGNANDYFSYNAANTSFTILDDTLTSIEVIFTSDEYGKVHFTADLTASSGGNDEGAGAKEDDPKEDKDQILSESGLVQKFLYYLDLDVTVSDGTVTDITLKNADEIADQNYDYAISAVEGIKAQLAETPVSSVDDLDVVSGATLSSNGVKKAIADALGQDFDLTTANGKLVMGKNGEVGLADSIKKATNFLKLTDLSVDEEGNYIIPDDKSDAWKNLYTLYLEAEKVVNDDSVSAYDKAILEAQIDQAVVVIQKESGSSGGHGGSAVTIDKTALEALISQAQALDSSLYTEESWNRMTEELDEAVALDQASRISSQDTVDGMVSDLQAAMDALVKNTPEETADPSDQEETDQKDSDNKEAEATDQKDAKTEVTEDSTKKTDTAATGNTTAQTASAKTTSGSGTSTTTAANTSAKTSSSSTGSVATGDTAPVVLFSALCFISALGLAVLRRFRKYF